jgi:hypothetical protein
MRSIFRVSLTVCAAVIFSTLVRADDEADAKALLDKAIKARGGADTLSKFKAATVKMKGKYYGMGDGIDFTLERSSQFPDRSRVEISGEANGQKFSFTQVLQGDKGWNASEGASQELSKEDLAETKENLYAEWVTQLYPLTAKEYKLAPLGESKVGDKEAIGLKVSRKDHRDINLYFDKKTSLLVKREATIKDMMNGGKEVAEEVLYDDYKEKDGVKYPAKVVVNRDGKKYVESETTEYKPAEKIDDKTFEKP